MLFVISTCPESLQQCGPRFTTSAYAFTLLECTLKVTRSNLHHQSIRFREHHLCHYHTPSGGEYVPAGISFPHHAEPMIAIQVAVLVKVIRQACNVQSLSVPNHKFYSPG